jgi:hypothetical protein
MIKFLINLCSATVLYLLTCFFLVWAVFILVCTEVNAQSSSYGKWFVYGSPYGVTGLYVTPDQAGAALANALNVARPQASWNCRVNIYEDDNNVQLECIPNNNYQYDSFNEYVRRSQAVCSSQQPSKFSWRTTINSFDAFDRSVPASAGPNPQCVDGCSAAFNTGGSPQSCTGYIAQGVARVIGAGILVVCTDPNIKLTGETCNYSGAELQNVGAFAGLPLINEVPDTGSTNPGTGGTSSTGLTPEESAAVKSTANSTADTSAKITSLSDALQGKLGTIASNITTADANNESRHQENKGFFGQMVSALQSIDGKTGTGSPNGGGTGNSNCGGTNQPACNVSLGGTAGEGSIGAMPSDPIAEVPQGGLQAPGETTIGNFISGIKNAPARDSGQCPKWTINMQYFRREYVMDAHCDLFDQNRAMLSAVCTVIWSIAALGIVLKA